MTVKDYKNWEETRKRGKVKFILTEGLAFGLIMAVVIGILTYFMDIKNPNKWDYIIPQSLFYIPAGFLYALWRWWYCEKQYKKFKK